MAEEKKMNEEAVEETPVPEEELVPEETAEEAAPEANPWEEKFNAEHDARLRVAAEYDNFRKSAVQEKDAASGNGKADAVAKHMHI